jgi:hypothetical protein
MLLRRVARQVQLGNHKTCGPCLQDFRIRVLFEPFNSIVILSPNHHLFFRDKKRSDVYVGVLAHVGTKCSRDMSFGGDNSSLATSDSRSIVKQCPIYTPLVIHSLILAEIKKTLSSFQSQDGSTGCLW